MENLGIYSIYDKKSERYDTPFFAISDLFAERRFRLMCEESGSMLKLFQTDFALCKLGELCILDGKIKEEFKVILEGKQFKKKKE